MTQSNAIKQARPERSKAAKQKLPLELGAVVRTPGVMNLPLDPLILALMEHQSGNWGDVCSEDWTSNDLALEHGDRILSSYSINGTKMWIITEWDRSVTTLLLPEEY